MTVADLDIDDLVERMDLEDEEDVREVVGFFLAAAAPRLVDLQSAIAAGDQANTRHHAHAAKGAAKSVGAGVLADHLIAIETALATSDWPEIESRGALLLSSLAQVEETLATWIPNFEPVK